MSLKDLAVTFDSGAGSSKSPLSGAPLNDDTQPTAPLEPLTGPVSGTGVEPTLPLVPYTPPSPAQQQPGFAPAPATYGYATTTVTRPAVGGVHITIAWLFAIVSFGYFLPWAVAATRQKSNTLAIGLLNFFVGWTVIGWIAALVMACASEAVHVSNVSLAVVQSPQPLPQSPFVTPAAGWYPLGSGQRYWDGQRWTDHTAP